MRIDIKDIKKGQKFWESDFGNNAYMEALTDAYEVNTDSAKGWEAQVRALEINGREVPTNSTPYTLFEAYESHGYGPRLYSNPAYVTRA